MFSVLKRPFAAPNAVIYSYGLSQIFLDKSLSSILEVGCGIGIFAMRYASSHPNVLVRGVDLSAKTIDFLSSNYGKHYKNLQLSACDFCEQDVDLGRAFDSVYSSDVLEHVTDTQLFVDNIFRHLRPGGKAVITFPNEETHGVNHFKEVEDVRGLFSTFSDSKVFAANIEHPVHKLWFHARSFYERLFSRSTREERELLYTREGQGIDCFEESTCFQFNQRKGKFVALAGSILAEAFLLIKPKIDVREIPRGAILNSPRLVVVATK